MKKIILATIFMALTIFKYAYATRFSRITEKPDGVLLETAFRKFTRGEKIIWLIGMSRLANKEFFKKIERKVSGRRVIFEGIGLSSDDVTYRNERLSVLPEPLKSLFILSLRQGEFENSLGQVSQSVLTFNEAIQAIHADLGIEESAIYEFLQLPNEELERRANEWVSSLLPEISTQCTGRKEEKKLLRKSLKNRAKHDEKGELFEKQRQDFELVEKVEAHINTPENTPYFYAPGKLESRLSSCHEIICEKLETLLNENEEAQEIAVVYGAAHLIWLEVQITMWGFIEAPQECKWHEVACLYD